MLLKDYELGVLGGQIGGGGKALALSEADRKAILTGYPPPSLPFEPVRVRYEHVDTSTVTLYTVPRGKKFIHWMAHLYNTTASGITYNHLINLNDGVGDRRAANALGSTATANIQETSPFSTAVLTVLEGDQTVKVAAGAAGLVSVILGWLVPDTFPLKMHCLDLTSVFQTLYEVPDGKIAVPVGSAGSVPWGVSRTPIFQLNNSGSARTITTRLVPRGDAPAAIHQLQAVSPNNNTNLLTTAPLPPFLLAGDRVMMNQSSDVAGAHARLTVLEVDA